MHSVARPNQPSRGIAFRIAAAICFALMSALLKIGASRGAGVVELILYRSAVGVPVVLGWVAVGPVYARSFPIGSEPMSGGAPSASAPCSPHSVR